MVGMRKFQVILASIVAVMFAIASMSAASSSYDSGSQGQLSPFFRRHLERRLAAAGGKGGVFHGARSAGRVRRLAGSANCTGTPNLCSDLTSFPVGSSCCKSACVDLMSDKNNCGFCAFKCPSSLGCCAGTCVSILTDNSNCGTCGTVCTTNLCSNGFCGYSG